jgi:hypothetical protein
MLPAPSVVAVVTNANPCDVISKRTFVRLRSKGALFTARSDFGSVEATDAVNGRALEPAQRNISVDPPKALLRTAES